MLRMYVCVRCDGFLDKVPDRDELEGRISRQHEDLAATRNELSRVNADRERLKQEVASLKMENAQLRQQVENQRKQIVTLVGGENKTWVTYDFLQQEVKQRDASIETLRAWLASSNDQLGEARRDIRTLKDQVESVADKAQKFEMVRAAFDVVGQNLAGKDGR